MPGLDAPSSVLSSVPSVAAVPAPRRQRRGLWFGGLVLLVLPTGCSDVQPLGAAGPVIPPGQTQSAQPPAAAVGLLAVLTAAAVDNLVTRATDANVRVLADPDPADPHAGADPATRQILRALTAGTHVVNLDVLGPDGRDLFPEATGTFTATVTGEAISSWPTGSAGTGSSQIAVSFTGAQAVNYTDPVSGIVAAVNAANAFTYTFSLSTDWTKTNGTTPASPTAHRMTLTAAVGGTGTSLNAKGTLSTGAVWSLTGTRSIAMIVERTTAQSQTDNTTTLTAATCDLTVVVGTAETSRFQRTSLSQIGITLGSSPAYAGPISDLPASSLQIHDGLGRY